MDASRLDTLKLHAAAALLIREGFIRLDELYPHVCHLKFVISLITLNTTFSFLLWTKKWASTRNSISRI